MKVHIKAFVVTMQIVHGVFFRYAIRLTGESVHVLRCIHTMQPQ